LIVVVAVEVKERGFGRIRLPRVPSVKSENLQTFITDVVEPGDTIHTDAWRGYSKLSGLGFQHRVTNQKRAEAPAPVGCRAFTALHRS
jgi:transposase-like protein